MSVVDRLGVNKLLQLLPHRAWPSSCLVVSGVHTAEQALTKPGPRSTWWSVIGRQILDASPQCGAVVQQFFHHIFLGITDSY